MIESWAFYAAAVPAVLLTGISKGGMGGVALLAVPMMSLAISPMQAAAIMLPILIVMDVTAVWTFRKSWDRASLVALLPGAILGIGVGWLTADMVNEDSIRILIGVVAVAFGLDYWLRGRKKGNMERQAPPPKSVGGVMGAVAGFTSFIAHAGGPPAHIYLLPQRLEKAVFVGTNAMFFAAVNAVKTVPYAALGQFSTVNLATAAVLAPLAPLGVFLGARLLRIVPQGPFYAICYGTVLIVGAKLLFDGFAGISGAM